MEEEQSVEGKKTVVNLDIDQLNIFREYLIGLRNHYGPYHERKEQVVWAATTIYMTGIFAIIISVLNNFNNVNMPGWSKLGFSVVLVFTLCLLVIFIYKEFKSRQFAAEMVRVVGELLAKLSNPSFKVSLKEIEDKKYRSEINGQKYVFPKIFCDYLDNENKVIQGKLHIPYKPFYALIFVWTLAILILIWILPNCVCP